MISHRAIIFYACAHSWHTCLVSLQCNSKYKEYEYND
jgi:hypothetical protein